MNIVTLTITEAKQKQKLNKAKPNKNQKRQNPVKTSRNNRRRAKYCMYIFITIRYYTNYAAQTLHKIKHLQMQTDLIFTKTPFRRLVLEIITTISGQRMRIQKDSLTAL